MEIVKLIMGVVLSHLIKNTKTAHKQNPCKTKQIARHRTLFIRRIQLVSNIPNSHHISRITSI